MPTGTIWNPIPPIGCCAEPTKDQRTARCAFAATDDRADSDQAFGDADNQDKRQARPVGRCSGHWQFGQTLPGKNGGARNTCQPSGGYHRFLGPCRRVVDKDPGKVRYLSALDNDQP